MTLNINESLRTDGTPGTDGTSGANGTDADPNGAAGGNGQPGAGVSLGRTGLVLLGDAGGDVVTFELQAVGGRGGSGSLGGAGKSSTATVTSTSSPGSSLTEAVYGVPGGGGAGGNAAAAGAAEVTYTNLDIDLAGGLASQNSLRLWGVAWGGNGGSGGTSGAGGSSGYTGLSSSTTLGPPAFTTTNSQLGTAGGAAPDGADGGAGATATVRFDDVSVVGQNNLVTFFGTVIGGSGGSGGSGSRGGSGSTGAAGGNGGDGGDGALGLAEATRLDVQATGGLNLTVYLDARGGQGNQGGGGGNAGFGQTSFGNFTNSVGSTLNTTIYAANGRGGDGGDGGDGVARLADSTITGSSVTDNVLLYMRAAGGLAGPGRGGAPEVASSTTTGGTTTTVVQGTPAGQRGFDGAAGNAIVEIQNITISLGDGADRLEFDLLASGPGTNQVIVSGNSFDGGIGTDRLLLGTGKLGEPGAVVDVALGFFRLGTSPVNNTMTGFEVFDGTLAADLFTGGGGGQIYRLGGGNDTFTGGGGDESVDGGADDDSIAGGGGNDTLLGGAGNDTLIGGTGADTLRGDTGADSMAGGAGNDSYAVDDPADRIAETLTGGADTVYSSVTWTLGAHLEDLVLTGAAPINGTGNNLNNVITGNGAANTLLGGGRADTLIGGGGNDLYLIDATDVLIEQAGGGHDTVVANATFTLSDHIEVLRFNGAANVRGDGNAGDNFMLGNVGNNRLLGYDGNDTLNGGLGDDTLQGGEGADSLVGGEGADRLDGGNGNDTYVLVDADVVIELANAGIDTVLSNISYALPNAVENLSLLGSGDLSGTGNALQNLLNGNSGANLLRGLGEADRISGGGGADTIEGGVGADTLTGGGGADRFLWLTPAEGGDTVTDFVAGSEKLAFANAAFGALGVGALNPANFANDAPNAAVGQFVYTKATGLLEWDADGTGGIVAVTMATLSNKPTLAATDFEIVA